MNRDQLLIAVAAGVLVLGLALVWSGWTSPSSTRRTRSVDAVPLVAGLVTTAAMIALSSWPIAACVAGVVAGVAVDRWRRAGAHRDTPEHVEALASWVESVRDVLQAAGQPIGAIGATVDTASPVLRGTVRRLFARLGAGRPPEWAFRAFADELDDPLGDLVATGLLIAVTRGAQTEQVLTALADQARQQADRRRIVEAERAPMRHQVLAVSAIMCLLLAGVFVFARASYLNAYDTGSGQIVLAMILVGYAALLGRVAALSRFPRPSRFLTLGRPEDQP